MAKPYRRHHVLCDRRDLLALLPGYLATTDVLGDSLCPRIDSYRASALASLEGLPLGRLVRSYCRWPGYSKGGIVTESQYQAKLIKKLEKMFPDCLILKSDSNHRQGILDLLILWRDKWASLEVKASPDAAVQPNQDYYVNKLEEMSFAAYIYPENEEEVLSALQQAFGSSGRARVS
jgi:hypothetical protein